MGIFTRLTDIVNANLNALLDRAENPQRMIRLIIQEMEDTLVEVRSATVQVIADRAGIGREIAQARREAQDWTGKAEIALERGREDLARGALAAKVRAEARVSALAEQLDVIEADIAKANEDIGRLTTKLADAKAREQALIARTEVAQQRLKIRGRLHDQKIADAFQRFGAVERSLDELHGQIASYDLGNPGPGEKHAPSLEAEILDMERQHKVDIELAALKAKQASRPIPGAN